MEIQVRATSDDSMWELWQGEDLYAVVYEEFFFGDFLVELLRRRREGITATTMYLVIKQDGVSQF